MSALPLPLSLLHIRCAGVTALQHPLERASLDVTAPHVPALHLQVTAPLPPCSVGDVKAVMLWTDPWLTARVFGGVLYALVCLRQLLSGGLQGQMLHQNGMKGGCRALT